MRFAIVVGLLALVLKPSASAAQEAQRAAIATAADIAAALVKMGKQPHVNDAVIQISPFRVLVENRNPGPQGANLHQNAAEVYYVMEGAATIVTGGRLIDPVVAADQSAGNFRGVGVEGGVSQKISKGDIVMIPMGAPHAFSAIEGSITYMSVHLPRPAEQK